MQIVYPETIYTYKRSDLISNIIEYLDGNDNKFFWSNSDDTDRFKYNVNVEFTKNPNLPYYPDYLFKNSILDFNWSVGQYALFEENDQNILTLPIDFNNKITKTIYSNIPTSITPTPGQVFSSSIITSIVDTGYFINQEIIYDVHIFRSLYDLIPVLLIKIGENDIVLLNKDSYDACLMLRNTEVEFTNTSLHDMSISYDLTYNKDIIQITELQFPGLVLTQTDTGCNLKLTLHPSDKLSRYTELPFEVKINYPDNRGYYKPYLSLNGDEVIINPDGVSIKATVISDDSDLVNGLNKETFIPMNINNCQHLGIALYKPMYLNINKIIIRYFLPVIHTFGFGEGHELYLQDAVSDISPKLDLSTFQNPIVGAQIYGKKLTSSDCTFDFLMRMDTLAKMNKSFNSLIEDIQAFNFIMNENMVLVEDYDSSVYKKVNFSSAVTKRYDKGLVVSLLFNNQNSLSYKYDDNFNDEYWYRGQYPSTELFFYIDSLNPDLNINFKNITDDDWTTKKIMLRNLDPTKSYVYVNNDKSLYVTSDEDDDQVHIMKEITGHVDKMTDTVVMSNYGIYDIQYDISDNNATVNINVDTGM
jgi:hypothetical protein